ncbi:hypothetical protein M9Y10_043975 [Tritrichomonas musculus]|uniref:Myb-like DNA-binding domain containing protein n=1 Tax=Tritrichomonas musculus TaxID=1915356 RepID=A0ABR2K173_9EUKA
MSNRPINDQISNFHLFDEDSTVFSVEQSKKCKIFKNNAKSSYDKTTTKTKETSLIQHFSFLTTKKTINEQIFTDITIQKEINKIIQKSKYKPHQKWSKEEDEKLKKLVEEFGVNDWRHLAKKMEGRNSRQCRERYQYYLNPSLIRGQWTREEDELIISLRNNLGPQWMKISKYFEHRTDAMIKNRYNSLIRNSNRQKEEYSFKSQYFNNSIISDQEIEISQKVEDKQTFCDDFDISFEFLEEIEDNSILRINDGESIDFIDCSFDFLNQ